MSDSPYIFNATADNFQQGVIENSHKVPVVVDFWAEWCEPCKILIPILEKLTAEFAGGFVLAKVNSETEQQLSTEYRVRSIPAVKIFRHGEVVNEFTGAQSEDFIREIIARYVATEADTLRDKAIEAIRAGDKDAGRSMLQQAAELDPRNAAVQIDIAHLDAEQGDYQAAADRLQKLGVESREKPAVVGLLSKMEFAAAAENAPDKNTLQQQIADDAKNSAARYQLAALCATEGDYQTALEQLLQILMRDRKYNDDAGRRGMLAIYNMLGDDHELTALYRRKMFNAMH
ncbi:MAG: tetratricopeptide repeat protein [Gammaproteobacteria bacterium]|nr:tetratricopeptide repeat protein [Gammaproteobacteria bacterium]